MYTAESVPCGQHKPDANNSSKNRFHAAAVLALYRCRPIRLRSKAYISIIQKHTSHKWNVCSFSKLPTIVVLDVVYTNVRCSCKRITIKSLYYQRCFVRIEVAGNLFRILCRSCACAHQRAVWSLNWWCFGFIVRIGSFRRKLYNCDHYLWLDISHLLVSR